MFINFYLLDIIIQTRKTCVREMSTTEQGKYQLTLYSRYNVIQCRHYSQNAFLMQDSNWYQRIDEIVALHRLQLGREGLQISGTSNNQLVNYNNYLSTVLDQFSPCSIQKKCCEFCQPIRKSLCLINFEVSYLRYGPWNSKIARAHFRDCFVRSK